MHLKKIILILIGISIVLIGTIFILYKNYQNKNEEIIEIFKDEEEIIEEKIDNIIEDNQTKVDNVIVDIKGMVVSPGVYEVESKSRVNDVINIAGGLLEGADTSLINLAKIVEDEMIIIIYSKEEILEKYKDEVCICDCPEIKNDACIETSIDNEENKIVNINTATKEDLMGISGIGESKAEAVIKYREEYGIFNTTQDIKNVPGIGDSLFEQIKNYITV